MNYKYRLCVGLMITNKANKIFIAKRIISNMESHLPKNYLWQMPQGGIEDGESPECAAMREMKEEIGSNNVSIITESNKWYYYIIPKKYIPNYYNVRYYGQKQKWFLLKFLGTDSEINLMNSDTPEFNSWKWTSFINLPRLVIPFKKNVYMSVLKEFKKYLH